MERLQIAPPLISRESAIDGKGIFTKRDIPVGQSIMTLQGMVVNGVETSRIIDGGGLRYGDEVQIDTDLFVIPNGDCLYLNHSCNPSGGIRGERDLFALRDIKRGEEITFDYSTTVGVNQEESWPDNFSNLSWTMDCKCGSENCRRSVGNISTVPKITLRKYLEAGALPEFIKHQIGKHHLLE